MKLKVIIADDEALAREGLRLLLAEDSDIEVVRECSNGRETLMAIKEQHADVLFLDIQMPGKDEFEIISQIGIEKMPIVVFITAHNEYAVKAFEIEALDYLTKPVEIERLRNTLRRVKERAASHDAPITQEQLKSVFAPLNSGATPSVTYPQRILVPNGTKDIFVAVDEIEWIEADSYYSGLHVGPKRYLLRAHG